MVSILYEQALVEKCRKQNRHAQKALFDKYHNKMMTICLRYLKNEEDALEALNNAFLKVFTKINQYRAESDLESWIKKIVINSAIDFLRNIKSYRINFILTNEFQIYGEEKEEDITINEGFDALDFSKEEIFEMVKELPPASRIVFNLYVVDEFSHQQISKKLKISEGTSKWHLSNARTILKEKINKALILKNKNSEYGEEKAKFR